MCCLTQTVLVAQGEFGGIRGSVVDADFRAPVSGASITIEGEGTKVSSGDQGDFVISDLAPGVYSLTVVRDGFISTRLADIVVTPGQFAQVTAALAPEVVELEEFVVSAGELLDSDKLEVLNIQQEMSAMTSVLGAEFISKVGASDVGKALQKTAGISVIGGKDIVVRGLADRYNIVLLNNSYVPSSDPDKRSVNVDLFPGSIVQNLVTGKTFTPNLPAEATGGSVNIFTKSIPDKTYVKVKPGLAYNTQSTGNKDYMTYQGGGTGILGSLNDRKLPQFIKNAELPRDIAFGSGQLADQQFRDKVNAALPRTMGASRASPGPDFGIELEMGYRGEYWGVPSGLLFALNYSKKYAYEGDGYEGRYVWNAQGEAFFATRRTRVQRGEESLRNSVLFVAGLEPAPGDELKLTYFHNLSASDRATLKTGPKDVPATGPIPTDEIYGYRESLVYNERRLNVLQLAGKNTFDDGALEDRAKLSWAASYSMSSQDEPDNRFGESDTLSDLSSFFFPGVLPIPPFRRYWRELDDTRWNLNADFEYLLFEEGKKETKLKVGAAFDRATREYRADSFAYNVGLNNISGYPSDIKPFAFEGATWGRVWNYGNPLNTEVLAARPDLGHYLWRFTPPEFYSASQNIPAAYSLFDIDLTENLNAIIGFRVEQTNIAIEASSLCDIEDSDLAFLLLPPEDQTQQNRNDLNDPEKCKTNSAIQNGRFANINQTDVLPALSLRYDFTDTMALRGAFSRTIARPSFKEMAPVVIRDAESGDFFLGSSTLEISHITNYDIRWEWFPSDGSFFAITGFTKYIEDPIEKREGNGIIQFFNSDDAIVYGFEIEFDRDLSFIDPLFEPFSINGNFSYIFSSVPRDRFSIFGDTRRLQGQPDYIFNLNFNYDNEEYGISAGLFMNVTGQYVDAVGSAQQPDILVEPYTSLNAMLSFKIGESGKLTFRASNLWNSDLTKVYDNGARNIYSASSSGTTYSISYEQKW